MRHIHLASPGGPTPPQVRSRTHFRGLIAELQAGWCTQRSDRSHELRSQNAKRAREFLPGPAFRPSADVGRFRPDTRLDSLPSDRPSLDRVHRVDHLLRAFLHVDNDTVDT
jgi:hypothetical protein